MVFYDYLLNLVTGEIVRRREADALTLPAEWIRVYDPASVLDDEDLALDLSEQERLMEPLEDEEA